MIEREIDDKKTDDKSKTDAIQTIDEKIKTKLYENRMMFVNGTIDEKLSIAFCKEIYALSFENASPINIKLTTYGGDFDSTYMMVASIEDIKEKAVINCICSGAIASAGIDIMLPCSKRISHRTTTFLLHHHHGTRPGRYDQQVDNRVEDDMIARMRAEAVARYSNLSFQEAWDGMDRKEWWLNPEEMLSYGMIDEVL